MPGGDGTGPLGMGPMTGRRAGFCAGYDVPGFANPIPGGFRGRGRGLGFGRGRGFGRGFGWPGAFAAGVLPARNLFGAVSMAEEKAVLTEQVTVMEGALAEIKRRLSDLERGE